MSRPVYGARIGSHLGKPIYKTIETNGNKYRYDRLAKCDSDGCPLNQLDKNELMVNPGLIYKQVI